MGAAGTTTRFLLTPNVGAGLCFILIQSSDGFFFGFLTSTLWSSLFSNWNEQPFLKKKNQTIPAFFSWRHAKKFWRRNLGYFWILSVKNSAFLGASSPEEGGACLDSARKKKVGARGAAERGNPRPRQGSFLPSLYLQKSASLQPRTGLSEVAPSMKPKR